MSKQEVQVKVPAKTTVKKAYTKTVARYTCDICGNSIDKSQDNRYSSGMSKCSVCDRDICRTKKTNGLPTCFTWDPNETGDYPGKFCIVCIPLYLPARSEMQERHWKEEEELEKRIKKESLSVKPS